MVGVDENGVGPRLGPMTVTMAHATARDVRAERVARGKPPRSLSSRLGDSKVLVRFGDTALGEAWARAWAASRGIPAPTPEALFRALSLDDAPALERPCPDGHAAQCWSVAEETFAAPDESVAQAAEDLGALARRGVVVHRLATVAICARNLNSAARAGKSRFSVDLSAMERLVLAARGDAGADVLAICGKVGGFDRYGPDLDHLAHHPRTVICEGRPRSAYRVTGVGQVEFVRDADANHLVVCLASLVGKWARDLLMKRIVRFYRAMDASLTDASGYHDPVTARFVEATRLLRRGRPIEDACFERIKVPEDARRPRSKRAETLPLF